MKPSYTYEQLISKIVRAEDRLERARTPHRESCPADQGDGPCTCGADVRNRAVEDALEELKL